MSAATTKQPSVETLSAAAELEAVARSFGEARGRIVVRCEPDVALSPAQIEPVRTIAREAIENALRYAYPDGMAGKIWLGLDEVRGRVTLTIRDAGVGFPADARAEAERERLGVLARELKGYARIDNRNYGGAEVMVTFPAA